MILVRLCQLKTCRYPNTNFSRDEMRQSEKDISGDVTVVSCLVGNPVIGVVFPRRRVIDDRRVKSAESSLLRLADAEQFFQRSRLEMKA